MTVFINTTFTAADATGLTTSDPSWTKFHAGDDARILSNRVHSVFASGTPSKYAHNEPPPNADYEVSADLWIAASTTTAYSAGVAARIVYGELTCYWARYRPGTGWQLFRYNTGTATQLGSTVAETISAGSTRRVRLRVVGSVISLYRDAEASPLISVTDGSPITAAGFAGFITSARETDGPHIDNFTADSIPAPATATTLSGPSGGTVLVASTNFSVGANGTITGTVTVTPSDGGDGGTFSPTSVEISSATPTATFTYTPATVGAKTISISDDGGLGDASDLTYTATLTAATLTSSPLKNNTGTVLAAAAFEAYINNPTSGALVVKKTGLTSNGTGVVSFSDSALVAATSYRVVWKRTDTGAEGLETLTAT